MKEVLTKATHSSGFLLNELKECYQQATPIQEIIVRQILKQAVELERQLKEFSDAVNAERA